ncbi:MAG: C-GCAxxG-C-C family protein [Desulfotalea sp.]
MKSELTNTVKASAEEYFAAGLFCAESVVMALAKAQGIESELLPKIATVFCSGMSRTCGTCGALTGAMLGLSLGLGRSQSGDSAKPAYTATQHLIKKFEQEFGSRECHVLLGCDIGTAEGRAMFKEKKLRQRCAQYTGRAAEIAANILFENNDK